MIKRIAIMGCGSLGTILGAYLNRAGLDVTMVDAWQEHVDALNTKGATVCGGANFTAPAKACTPDKMEGTFDLFIYLAKQTFNETAIPQMVAHCHENTIIAAGQNGIPELEVAKYYPEDKIMGFTVGWPATFQEPGKSMLTMTEEDPTFEFHIGRLNGQVDDTLHEVAAVLDCMTKGRVHVTGELMKDRWAKILINATLSGMSTVAANTCGYIITHPRSAVSVVRIGRECLQVCRAMGMKLPVAIGLDFNELYDFSDEAGQQAAIDRLIEFYGPNNKAKASMLQDLEKGRKCEIRFINGTLAEAGDKVGIDTPYCDAVVDIVSKVERGELPLADHSDLMPELPV